MLGVEEAVAFGDFGTRAGPLPVARDLAWSIRDGLTADGFDLSLSYALTVDHGVVQTFFTRSSYYSVMAAVALDAYSAIATRRLVDTHGSPGPWNAKWVPTARQLEAYAAAVRTRQGVRIAAPLSVNVGRNR